MAQEVTPGNAVDGSDTVTGIVREMAETSDAIAGIEDLSEMLSRLAMRAQELVHADYAAVSTFDETGRLTRFVFSGMDELEARRLGSPPGGRGLLGDLANHDTPIRLADLQLAPNFTGWPEGHPDMCAFLGVPIRALGTTVGSLYMTRVRGAAPFSATDEAAATVMALQIAATVSTALVRETQGRMDRLREREQIAQDLHDGTIQALYALGLEADVGLQACNDPTTAALLESIVRRINEVIRDIRTYIEMLEAETPASPPDLIRDLAFVIRQMVPSGVDVVSNVSAAALHELGSREIEDVLYVVREALSNAIRHGHPTRVAVDLRQTTEHTAITIQDNGVGFDVEQVKPNMGTITLRTRAARLGADLTVLSVPGMGTTVRLVLPRPASA